MPTETAIKVNISVGTQTRTSLLKIHVDQPFTHERAQYPIIHEVLHESDSVALCGADLRGAVWATGGNCCAMCDAVEMDLWEKGLLPYQLRTTDNTG